MLLDLCLLPRRKKKYRKVLRDSIHATLLDKHTYYIFYGLSVGLGVEYARAMLRDSMYDMVRAMYIEKDLGLQFYTDIARDLCDWSEKIMILGTYSPTPQREKFVFIHEQGIKAKRLYFQFGDHLFNKLSDRPAVQMEMSNIMFDVIDRMGQAGVEPVIHADGRRTISLFTLREGHDEDSMKD